MSKIIHKGKNYSFMVKEGSYYIVFHSITNEPFYQFEDLDMYLYEKENIDFINRLANDVIRNPPEYDQKLTFDNGQEIPPLREALYLDKLYYCDEHTAHQEDFFKIIKYAIGLYSSGESPDKVAFYLQKRINSKQFSQIDLTNLEHYNLISSFICLVHLLSLNCRDYAEAMDNLVAEHRLLYAFWNIDEELDIFKPIIHQDPYLFLSMHLTKIDDYLESYLRNYYYAFRKVSWFDSHRDNPSEFFGYWSFELAFIVRFFKIPDSAFKDNMFYPRDLALKKWLPSWRDDIYGQNAQNYILAYERATLSSINQLTRDIIEYANNEMESTLDLIMNEKIFSKTLVKFNESIDFFDSIGEEPTEEDLNKIRAIISEFSRIIGEFEGEIKVNKHLKVLEEEMRSQILNKYDFKSYTKKNVEQEIHEYLGSSAYKNLALKTYHKYTALASELLNADDIEQQDIYWDEIEKIFSNYGLLNQGANEFLKSQVDSSDTFKKSKAAAPYKISSNDLPK